MSLEITDTNFKEIVLDSEIPVLVDFGPHGAALSNGWPNS